MGPEKCSNQHKMEKKPGLDPERNKRNKRQTKEETKKKKKRKKHKQKVTQCQKGPVIKTIDVPRVFVSRVADISIQLAPRCHARTGLEP